MARIFRRRLDTAIATWTCLVALVGIVLLTTTGAPVRHVHGGVAVGAALATAAYGAFMTRLAGGLLRGTR